MNDLRKLRVHLARILLPFLTVWLCMLPAKSYAVVPLLAWGATAAVAAGDSAAAFAATATAVDVGALALQSLVGMTYGIYDVEWGWRYNANSDHGGGTDTRTISNTNPSSSFTSVHDDRLGDVHCLQRFYRCGYGFFTLD